MTTADDMWIVETERGYDIAFEYTDRTYRGGKSFRTALIKYNAIKRFKDKLKEVRALIENHDQKQII